MNEARARRLRVVLGGSLVTLAAAGVTFGLVTLLTGGDDGPGYRFATEQHVNEQGRFLFYHPPDWDVQDHGSVSRLTDPRAEVVVTFGLGPEGDLDAAETDFVTELQERYRGVELAALQVQRVGPNPALSVSGSGRNSQGVRIRFLAITVGTEERNFSIGVFTAANIDPEEVVPATQEIVNSFRPLPGAEG